MKHSWPAQLQGNGGTAEGGVPWTTFVQNPNIRSKITDRESSVPHLSILRPSGVLAALAFILLSATTSVAHSQCDDHCSDILRFGIFDESYLDSEHVDYQYLQYALRQNKRSSDRFQISQMLSYLSPLESFSNEWAASGESRRLEIMQTESLEERFTRDSLLHFARSANETLVNAWLHCISLGAGRPALTAKMSLDGLSFSLAADSGVRDLPLSLFGRRSWRQQLSIVPEGAILNCSRGFRADQTRDSITCQRNPDHANERIEITLLSEFGANQPVAVLPKPSDVVGTRPEPIREIAALNSELELGSHTFQALVYRPVVSVGGTPYANALVLASQDRAASMVTYRVPPGAVAFRTRVIAYQAHCDTFHGSQINGWRVSFSVPGHSETRTVESFWNDSRDQEVVIPLTNLSASSPRLLSIAVDPAGNRACDHSALGSPQFEPAHLRLTTGETSDRVASAATVDAMDQGCCRVQKYPLKTSWECYDGWTRETCYATASDLVVPVDFFKDTPCKGVPDCH